MFCNRQKHIESKSIFYQSIVILFLLQNPSNKHNCVQISIKIIESSKKSSILQNLPSYIPFQSAAIDRWPRYATVASDLFSFQFHLFLFSRFVNNSRGGRGNKRGPRRITAKGRMVYVHGGSAFHPTYVQPRTSKRRCRVWLTWEGAFLSRDTRCDEASLWSMPRGRSIFALDHSTNGMDFIRIRDGLLISKISTRLVEWKII